MANLKHVPCFLLLFTLIGGLQYSAFSLPEDKRWYNVGGPIVKYLRKSGCCEDRVECKEMNIEKPNYGDRIFKSVDASAAFQNPRLDSRDPIEIIHALLFGEIFAAHANISDETLDHIFVGLALTEHVRNPPSYEKLFGYSPVADGCEVDKVRAWMHYKGNHIFVCSQENGNRVIIKKVLNIDIHEEGDDEIIGIKEECIKEQASKNKGHPAMCEENLIDLLAIDEGNGRDTVVAYIDKLEGMDIRGNRIIEIKVWEDKVEQKQTDKYESRLASIYWYRLDDYIAHGIYFTTDAFVCKFEYELGKGDFTPDRFKFDKNQEPEFCRPMSVYLECPQGWCYELGMTTSFTIKHKGFYYVYFTKSLFHWRIKTRNIPMSVPRVEDALFYGSARQSIWEEGQKYQGQQKVGEAPYPPIMIFDAAAAFRMKHNNEFYTFIYHPHPANGWNSVPDHDSKDKSKGTLATNWMFFDPIHLELFDGIKPEAAYFDERERKLYLFEGSQYTVFQVNDTVMDIATKDAWKKVDDKPKSVEDLGFKADDTIKEVIALGDNLNFIINATHFYYSVGNITDSEKVLKFSFTELFRVQSECYYNDYREFKKTLKMHGIELPVRTVSERKYKAEPTALNEKTSTWGTIAILVIVALGVGVALVGLLAMFLSGRVKNRTKVTIVKQYCTASQLKAVKERQLSKETMKFSKLKIKNKL